MHDHKFDPIPTIDYYSIAGIFQNTRVGDHPLVPQQEIDDWNAAIKAIGDYRKETDERLRKLGDELVDRELDRLECALAALAYAKLEPKPQKLRDWAREQGLVGTIFQYAQPFFAGPENSSKLAQADTWFRERTAESLTDLKQFLIENPEDGKRKEFTNRIFRHDRNQVLEDLPTEVGEAIKVRREEHKKMEAGKPEKYPFAHALREAGRGNMKVAIRGNLLKPGEEARRFLRILDEEQPPFTDGSGRRELAAAVTDPANPLTARVFVNRVWGWHFGHGLVRTPSNFGLLGEAPSHPQLLDWLAASFVEDGWSLKALHRRILNSATWRQSSQFDEASFNADGDNRLLWRMNPQKLTAEVWRDSALFVSGELDPELGGKPFDNPDTDLRRTIHARASGTAITSGRTAFFAYSTFPCHDLAWPQAYADYHAAAVALSSQQRIRKSGPKPCRPDEREEEPVHFLYRVLFSRKPEPAELKVGLKFLSGADPAKNRRYAQALLASNEFMFME